MSCQIPMGELSKNGGWNESPSIRARHRYLRPEMHTHYNQMMSSPADIDPVTMCYCQRLEAFGPPYAQQLVRSDILHNTKARVTQNVLEALNPYKAVVKFKVRNSFASGDAYLMMQTHLISNWLNPSFLLKDSNMRLSSKPGKSNRPNIILTCQ